MAEKFDKMLTIIGILDRGEVCTPDSLAIELGVTVRSIFRYIKSLEATGFPIYFDRDRGSYMFMEGFSLKKAGFSTDERLALSIARQVLDSMGSGLQEVFGRIDRKICSLSSSGNASDPASVVKVSFNESHGTKESFDLLNTLTRACAGHNLVFLVYESMYAQELSEREIEPYYLFFSPDGFWNLRAYCRMREEWRTFALERMRECKVLENCFMPRMAGDELNQDLERGFGTYTDGPEEEIVVRFAPEAKAFVQRRKWHASQKNTELPDGSIEVRFFTDGMEGAKRWLYRWTPYFRVLKPNWLRKEMAKELRLQAKYLRSPGKRPC